MVLFLLLQNVATVCFVGVPVCVLQWILIPGAFEVCFCEQSRDNKARLIHMGLTLMMGLRIFLFVCGFFCIWTRNAANNSLSSAGSPTVPFQSGAVCVPGNRRKLHDLFAQPCPIWDTSLYLGLVCQWNTVSAPDFSWKRNEVFLPWRVFHF